MVAKVGVPVTPVVKIFSIRYCDSSQYKRKKKLLLFIAQSYLNSLVIVIVFKWLKLMMLDDGFESPSVKQNQVQYNVMLGCCQNSTVEHHVKDMR